MQTSNCDSEKAYVRVPADTQNLLLKQVDKGRTANPDLMVLSLDYAAQDQTDIIKEAIAFSRKRGFIPYVSTYQLDEIFFSLHLYGRLHPGREMTPIELEFFYVLL